MLLLRQIFISCLLKTLNSKFWALYSYNLCISTEYICIALKIQGALLRLWVYPSLIEAVTFALYAFVCFSTCCMKTEILNTFIKTYFSCLWSIIMCHTHKPCSQQYYKNARILCLQSLLNTSQLCFWVISS